MIPEELQQLLKGEWFTLSVGGAEVHCEVALEKAEDSEEMSVILTPDRCSLEDAVLTVTADGLRQLDACGVTLLKMRYNGNEILLSDGLTALLKDIEEKELEMMEIPLFPEK